MITGWLDPFLPGLAKHSEKRLALRKYAIFTEPSRLKGTMLIKPNEQLPGVKMLSI
jgi:hypothetical protein